MKIGKRFFGGLRVNKVTGERAELIYQAARAERVKSLRIDGLKALGLGLACLSIAVACYFGFRLDELEVSRFGDRIHRSASPSLVAGLSSRQFC